MMSIPFDVNDEHLRSSFLDSHLPAILAGLQAQVPPLWGQMSAQHVLEHLLWAFHCSTGKLALRCHTPESILSRTKRFLYDSRPTPHLFRNPELGDTPPPFQFSSFAEAKKMLQAGILDFRDYFRNHPEAVHVHPIFGPLGQEEWERSHFKHCCHHLLQFGQIEQAGS